MFVSRVTNGVFFQQIILLDRLSRHWQKSPSSPMRSSNLCKITEVVLSASIRISIATTSSKKEKTISNEFDRVRLFSVDLRRCSTYRCLSQLIQFERRMTERMPLALDRLSSLYRSSSSRWQLVSKLIIGESIFAMDNDDNRSRWTSMDQVIGYELRRGRGIFSIGKQQTQCQMIIMSIDLYIK